MIVSHFDLWFERTVKIAAEGSQTVFFIAVCSIKMILLCTVII